MTTKEQIIEAAKGVFLQKGFAGARMQQIADEVGINKAMLHYYFKSKQLLFEVIFEEAIREILPQVNQILLEKGTIMEKIEHIVVMYIDSFKKNPHMPLFVMHELSMNPEKFVEKLRDRNDLPQAMSFLQQIQMASASGEIRPINPIQLLLNVISMSVFPFIARPMLKAITQIDDTTFNALMESRKTELIQFIRDAIVPT